MVVVEVLAAAAATAATAATAAAALVLVLVLLLVAGGVGVGVGAGAGTRHRRRQRLTKHTNVQSVGTQNAAIAKNLKHQTETSKVSGFRSARARPRACARERGSAEAWRLSLWFSCPMLGSIVYSVIS